MKYFLVIILLALTIQVNCDGYGEQYEPPAQKMKFNIGFNLPSMSISLPKLELPQISIQASVKQKKPFTLQLPVIKFNAHAATEEDDSYPSGGGGGGSEGYASAGPDTSAYAGVQSGGYLGPAASMGYERPSSGQYGASEPDSGYASSSHQQPAATSPYNNQGQSNQYQPSPQPAQSYGTSAQPQQQYQPQQQPQQQYQPQQQPQQQLPQYQEPQPAYNTNSAQAYSVQPAQYQQEPQQPSHYGFQGRAIADYRASTSANGYYVPKPQTSQNQQVQVPRQVSQYQQPQLQLRPQQNQHQTQVQPAPIDENIRYYNAAQPLYQRSPIQMNQQPAAGNYEIITAPEFAKLYGSRLHSNFARRSSPIRVPDYETVWFADS